MTMAEPQMPAHEPPLTRDDQRDIDTDADEVDLGIDAPAGEEEHPGAARPAFRTPAPGERLTAGELQTDLDTE
jgi:hypothetical protein